MAFPMRIRKILKPRWLLTTTTGTAAGEGGHMGGVGMSQRRGLGIELRTNDPNQTFGVENPFEPFASDPVKPSQRSMRSTMRSPHRNQGTKKSN